MVRMITFMVALLTAQICEGQVEHFFLQTDKKICYPSDTIWFRAYVLNDSLTRSSTSFYVELYGQDNLLISRQVYPLSDGTGFGQMQLQQQPGVYWFRAYTLHGNSETIVPLTVLNEEGKNVVRSFSKGPVDSSDADWLSFKKVEGQYFLCVDQRIKNFSVAVTSNTDPGNATLLSFPPGPSFHPQWDTGWLTYKCQIVQQSKKASRVDGQMMVYFKQDSFSTSPMVLPIDGDQNVVLPAMYFYGPGELFYTIQQKNRPAAKAPLLSIFPTPHPPFHPPPPSLYRNDTLTFPPKPLQHPQGAVDNMTGKEKQLKMVEIKARWQDRNRALNKRYVMKPEFAPMEHYSLDLRSPLNPGRIYYVLDYLNSELPKGWMTSSLQSCSSGIVYYIDEQPVSGQIVAQRPLSDFAYVKVFQDLHPPCPAICLYTRKGDDLAVLPAELKSLKIEGYNRPLSWTTPDHITLLWEPYLTGKEYQFRLREQSFKIIVIGTGINGEAFFYEKVVNQGK
ncbi:hypothetical protein PV783_24585 [Chitinophaga sp. CC14]|uniref:hypothetical protein n=1 Tax=Chitinophaga sp. CC14 TaxID=3029199 RepID=UPI003B8289D3